MSYQKKKVSPTSSVTINTERIPTMMLRRRLSSEFILVNCAGMLPAMLGGHEMTNFWSTVLVMTLLLSSCGGSQPSAPSASEAEQFIKPIVLEKEKDGTFAGFKKLNAQNGVN